MIIGAGKPDFSDFFFTQKQHVDLLPSGHDTADIIRRAARAHVGRHCLFRAQSRDCSRHRSGGWSCSAAGCRVGIQHRGEPVAGTVIGERANKGPSGRSMSSS